MLTINKIFANVVIVGMMVGYSAHAQVLAGSDAARDVAATASSADAEKTPIKPKNLLSPVDKNFNYSLQDMVEPKDDPQVFHFKIVDGKVALADPEKRHILVYYDNYRVIHSFDKMTKCSIRVYVINDLKEKITSLGFKLHWPDISTAVEMSQVKSGVKTYTDLMLIGDGCLRIDKIPTIEVNRCRVKGMSQDACADAIMWMPR